MALNKLSEGEARVVLVSGGSRGFGKSLVASYLDAGWKVASFSRSEICPGDDVNIKNSAHRDNFFSRQIDACNIPDVESFVQAVLKKWGRLDVLINNAGMRYRKPFLEISKSNLKEVLDTNLISPAFLTQIVLHHMVKQRYGNIINISSILGTTALTNLSAYQISKFGLNGLTKSIAAEFCENNINCNAIAPGFCKTSYFENFKTNEILYENVTNRIPMKRWGEQDEIVGMCLFLSTEQADYINGAILPIDGGWTS